MLGRSGSTDMNLKTLSDDVKLSAKFFNELPIEMLDALVHQVWEGVRVPFVESGGDSIGAGELAVEFHFFEDAIGGF